MDFYYGRVSGNSTRAAFGLLEAGVTFQPHLLDTRSGENRSAEYLSINPMGKIPSLVDGGFKLWESNAINWYIAEKFPKAGLLPTSVDRRALVQHWLLFQTGHVSPACIAVYRESNQRMRAFWQTSPNPQAAEAGRKELARYLPVLEGALANQDWLERDFTIADIAYAPHLVVLAEGGFDFSPYPRMRGWLDRMQARPAWQKAAEMIFGQPTLPTSWS
jgi:glutathione S-transferase